MVTSERFTLLSTPFLVLIIFPTGKVNVRSQLHILYYYMVKCYSASLLKYSANTCRPWILVIQKFPSFRVLLWNVSGPILLKHHLFVLNYKRCFVKCWLGQICSSFLPPYGLTVPQSISCFFCVCGYRDFSTARPSVGGSASLHGRPLNDG